MLTFYTAIGHLKLKKAGNGKTVPVVINGPQEYGMGAHETALWSCLSFRILTIYELESAYKARLPEPDTNGGMTFSQCLNRLLLRGLVAKGDGMTAADALYQLLGELQIRLIRKPRPTGLLPCIRFFLKQGIRYRDLKKYRQGKRHDPLENAVLDLARTVPLTVAELITCMDNGQRITDEEDVKNLLYRDPDTTYLTLTEDARLWHTQYPVLQAIGSLYLKKQITFMKT